QGRHRRGCSGGPASGRRSQVVRQILERIDGGDHVKECRPKEGGQLRQLSAGAMLNALNGASRREESRGRGFNMNVLVVAVGGTHVKILATGEDTRRKFPSGPTLSAGQVASGVKKLARGWDYHVVSVGYPGPVLQHRPVAEPHNLGPGWVGFDFEKAFGCPVRVINDAAMQALGSYQGGKLLFLGLGTGFGSAMVVDGIVEPMELGRLPYRKATYEHYVGLRGLEHWGKEKWRCNVADVVARLTAAL